MKPRTSRTYTTHNTGVDAQIAQLCNGFTDETDRRLLIEMMVSVYRLGADKSTTGDLKILNAALKELRYAFKVFRPYRAIRKVALFGSARMPSEHPAYPAAKEFGFRMAQAGWMVITGAASGIMAAGHEGAGEEASFGLNIRLPFEQEANPVIAKDPKLINCKYFFTRKLLFLKESHATVLFPGGFGTLDEGFESITLVQTGKSDPRPILFVDPPGQSFWKPLIRFFDRQLIKDGMVSASERSIYTLVDDPRVAAQHIVDFYAVYHSLRYVAGNLVLRLQQPLSPGAIDTLANEYRDVLASGSLTQGVALPEESDEPQLAKLPRLIFHFNRQHYGRLIHMIHRINALGTPPKRPTPPTDSSVFKSIDRQR